MPNTPVTPTSLLDEVLDVLARGEAALFADLAKAAWQPHATLASLAGSLAAHASLADQREAA